MYLRGIDSTFDENERIGQKDDIESMGRDNFK
jgi:hypothetical protein